jgi:hypothetical protein
MAPSCCIKLSLSTSAQRSTILPPAIRLLCISVIVSEFPLGGYTHERTLVGSLPPQAVYDLITLGDHILDRLAHVRAGEAEHGKKLFVALQIWWSPRLVKDELWSEDLIEDVGIPGPKNILDEFVEALEDGLVLFRGHILLCPPSCHSPGVLHPFL